MSLEQALVDFINADTNVAALATQGGGYLGQLPKGFLNPDGSWYGNNPPTWTYLRYGGNVDHTLDKKRGPRQARIQIDVYGKDAADGVTLALAIDNALDTFEGPYGTSPDITGIISCLLEQEPVDNFDPAARTWRRTLEYHIFFS